MFDKQKTRIIKIDYDRKYILRKHIDSFIRLFVNLKNYKGIRIIKLDVKESNKGIHIIIRLNKEITEQESLFYATLCGSDTVRETFNYCRLLAGHMITYNFFSKRKTVYDFKTGKRIYRSVEKDNTKRIRKIKRKLWRYVIRINKGLYEAKDGKYF